MICKQRLLPVRSSSAWPVVGQAGFAGASFVVSIAFARLAGPSVFGEYVFALTWVSMLSIVGDLCLQPMILTSRSFSRTSNSVWAVFGVAVNVVLGIATVTIVVLHGSPAGAVLGWAILCCSMPLLPVAQTLRAHAVLNGRQSLVAGVDVLAVLISSVIALVLVAGEPSFAALSIFTLALAVSRLALLWGQRGAFGPFRRRLVVPALLELRRGVAGFYPLQLLAFAGRNLDNAMVGVISGAVPLAFYSRAYALLLGPLVQAQVALSPVSILRISRDRATFLRTALLFPVLVMPVVALVLMQRHPMVLALYGPQWSSVGDALLGLVAGGAFLATSLPCRWILQASRRNRHMAVDASVQLVFIPLAAVGAVFGGAVGAALLVGLVGSPIVCLVEFWLVAGMGFESDLRRLVGFSVSLLAVGLLAQALVLSLGVSAQLGLVAGAALAALEVAAALVARQRFSTAIRVEV